MFFSPNDVFSYNCILNFVVSARGAGKTHGSLKYILNKCFEKDRQFIYLRRTDTEVQKVKQKLFEGLYAADDLHRKLSVEGDAIIETEMMGKDKKVTIRGYIIPLSLAKQYKSSAFPKVDFVLFDEFISEDNRYLSGEVDKFLSIFETVARHRSNVKALLLGNLSSSYNPYFLFWGLTPKGGFTVNRERGIVIQQYESKDFKEMKANTPFAKLIEGTRGGDFILDNKAILDDTELVKKVKSHKNILFTFMVEETIMTAFIFMEDKNYCLYVAMGGFNSQSVFNFDSALKGSTFNVSKNNHISRKLKRYALFSRLYFENPHVKALCEKIIF